VSERAALLRLLGGAEAAIESARRRIDDLNVYPVPHGDTGTNLAETVHGVIDALEASAGEDRATLAGETSRAALMAARGTSGLILSQIVRGLADSLAAASELDSPAVAHGLRAGCDAAYRAVREPVEGTMLTVIRVLADAAAQGSGESVPLLLARLVEEGETAVAATQAQLDVLREAAVVDAGAAGLVELLRGVAAAVTGERLAAGAVPAAPEPSSAGIAHGVSGFRYCTSFVVEGELEAAVIEAALEEHGDSLIVVGDGSAVKVHLHTDDPGAALTIATRSGSIDNVDIADLKRQTDARERRLALVEDDRPVSAE
jgi:dihydroxyacetone kinase-like predicted kinase